MSNDFENDIFGATKYLEDLARRLRSARRGDDAQMPDTAYQMPQPVDEQRDELPRNTISKAGPPTTAIPAPSAPSMPAAPALPSLDVPPFILANGVAIASVSELLEMLPRMPSDVFDHHVTPHKNDFATWLYHGHGNAALAQAIGHVKDKEAMRQAIVEHQTLQSSEAQSFEHLNPWAKKQPSQPTAQHDTAPPQAPPEQTPQTAPPQEFQALNPWMKKRAQATQPTAPSAAPAPAPPTTQSAPAQPTPQPAPPQATTQPFESANPWMKRMKTEPTSAPVQPAIPVTPAIPPVVQPVQPQVQQPIAAPIMPAAPIRPTITEPKEILPELKEVKQESKPEPKPSIKDIKEEPKATAPEPKPEIKPVSPAIEIGAAQKPSAPQTTVGGKSSVIDIAKMSAREILEKAGIVDYNDEFIAVEEQLKEAASKRPALITGVPGFDDMIPRGIPSGHAILLNGGPGSGKTTFAIQTLGNAAKRGERCLFLTLEETEEELIAHLESYGFDPKTYIQQGNLLISEQDPFKISRMVEALLAHARGELLIDIEEVLNIIPPNFNPSIVVLDSLSAIASAFNESNTAYRIYVNQLINILKRTGATSFLINEVQGVESTGHGTAEEFLADGVLIFYNLQKRDLKQPALEILKMRATAHEKRIVPFVFQEGTGIIIYPLEKTFM